MADQQGNPIDTETTGDRVVMLSLNSDGSVRQRNPQMIGDKDVALAAAKEQFRQQAVSAADRRLRGVSTGTPDVGAGEPDPVVAQVVQAHKDAEKKAEAAAEAAVDALHQGEAGTNATGTVEGLSSGSAPAAGATGATGSAGGDGKPAGDTGSTGQ